jgi:hypothetical protein
MSAQTPQTDNKAYTPFEDDANPQVVNAEFARLLEADRDRLKALCEELLTAAILISDALHSEEAHGAEVMPYTDKAWEKLSVTIESSCAALKKAQKDI